MFVPGWVTVVFYLIHCELQILYHTWDTASGCSGWNALWWCLDLQREASAAPLFSIPLTVSWETRAGLHLWIKEGRCGRWTDSVVHYHQGGPLSFSLLTSLLPSVFWLTLWTSSWPTFLKAKAAALSKLPTELTLLHKNKEIKAWKHAKCLINLKEVHVYS